MTHDYEISLEALSMLGADALKDIPQPKKPERPRGRKLVSAGPSTILR